MAETGQYLYKIQPTRHDMLKEGLTPEEEEIMREHFAYLLPCSASLRREL